MSRAEKRALKRQQKNVKHQAKSPNTPWQGQLLKVFRMGPPMPDQDQTMIREEFEDKLRQHRDQVFKP